MPAKTKKTNGSYPDNDPTYYPGKPGPAPTGRTRKIQIPFMVTELEFEYLKRRSRYAKRSMNEIIRAHMIPSGWRADLISLRKTQGANIPS